MQFFGSESETIVRNERGEYWLIQSPDLVNVKSCEKLDGLPPGFEKLDPSRCCDLEIPEAAL